jgi:hypothetical protein
MKALEGLGPRTFSVMRNGRIVARGKTADEVSILIRIPSSRLTNVLRKVGKGRRAAMEWEGYVVTQDDRVELVRVRDEVRPEGWRDNKLDVNLAGEIVSGRRRTRIVRSIPHWEGGEGEGD